MIRAQGVFFSSLCLFIFCLPLTARSGQADDIVQSYVDQLVKAAVMQNLHEDPYWKVLGHYKPLPLFGERSLIDDPKFFLSETGRHNPELELEATIRAFFGDVTEEHPQCRFPARYQWLSERLSIDKRKLPHARCNTYNEIFEKIKPRSAVLVFPSAYLNNPASMYGHTFVRIDSTYTSKLLGHAINYAAHTEEANGLVYAFKGIFGMYNGFYSVLPYYEKIKEYTDIEQRDMWEYHLDLNQEEVEQMFRHLWELKDIYSQYYFFDENCSYNLLFLIEAARPSLRLTDRFRYWAIPVDTVRAVVESGIAGKTTYRYSRATKIRHIASLLNDEQQETALAVIRNELSPERVVEMPFGKQEKIGILDIATERLQFAYAKDLISKDEYLRKYLAVLNSRSTLGSRGEDYQVPVPARPDTGHGSNRLSVAAGVRKGKAYQDVSLRPAYHMILDPEAGYSPGSQIEFGNFDVRFYDAEKKLRLHHFDFINILSLSAIDRFYRPISWKVSTGLVTRLFPNGRDYLTFNVNTGGGYSIENNVFGLLYATGDADFNYGGNMKHHYSAGIGASAGILKKINDTWKIHAQLSVIEYLLGDSTQRYRAFIEQGVTINRQNSLALSFSWEKVGHAYATEAKAAWNLFW